MCSLSSLAWLLSPNLTWLSMLVKQLILWDKKQRFMFHIRVCHIGDKMAQAVKTICPYCLYFLQCISWSVSNKNSIKGTTEQLKPADCCPAAQPSSETDIYVSNNSFLDSSLLESFLCICQSKAAAQQSLPDTVWLQIQSDSVNSTTISWWLHSAFLHRFLWSPFTTADYDLSILVLCFESMLTFKWEVTTIFH